jgi:ribonuclease HI
MAWIPMMLRGQRVLARCEADGTPRAAGGRVEIRYKPKDGKAYQAAARNLERVEGAEVLPDDHCGEGEQPPSKTAKKGGAKPAAKAPVHLEGAVIVYADGACSGNPGPAGLGVVYLDGELRRELSEYLGQGTNNIAELTAILRAVEAVAALKALARPVRIHTDSSYSIGVLTKGWKAKANQELVAKVRSALRALQDVELVYVPGHAGVPLNERADELARVAVTDRASTGWVEVTVARPQPNASAASSSVTNE